MQYICLSICIALNVDNGETEEITSDILEKAYKFTTSNLDYADVIKLISKGPLSKGKERTMYATKFGEKMDLYNRSFISFLFKMGEIIMKYNISLKYSICEVLDFLNRQINELSSTHNTKDISNILNNTAFKVSKLHC